MPDLMSARRCARPNAKEASLGRLTPADDLPDQHLLHEAAGLRLRIDRSRRMDSTDLERLVELVHHGRDRVRDEDMDTACLEFDGDIAEPDLFGVPEPPSLI